MKKKWQILTVVVSLILLTSILATACDTSTPAPTPDKGSTQAPQSTPEPASKPVEVKLSLHRGPGPTPANLAFEKLKDETEKRTEGRVTITLYFGGSLLKINEVLEGVQTGVADAAYLPTTFFADKIPLHTVTSAVPFINQNQVQLNAYSRAMLEKFPQYLEELERFNCVTIFDGSINGPFHLVSNKSISKLSDMKGLKFGGYEYYIPLWYKAAGAVSVDSRPTDFYQGMQTGIMDGGISSYEMALNENLTEVAKYFCEVNFGLTSGTTIAIMNKDTWDKISPQDQEIIKQLGKEIEDEFAQYGVEQEEILKQGVIDAGMTVIEFPDEERTKWASMPEILEGEQFWADNAGTEGPAFLEFYKNFER